MNNYDDLFNNKDNDKFQDKNKNTPFDKDAWIEKKRQERAEAYELLGTATVDEQRLLTETAIFADRIAVDEETVRLRSHLSQIRSLLKGDGAIGRKLDFVLQETNREINTVGSKSQNTDIAKLVVNVKAELEKIREQIQNIE